MSIFYIEGREEKSGARKSLMDKLLTDAGDIPDILLREDRDAGRSWTGRRLYETSLVLDTRGKENVEALNVGQMAKSCGFEIFRLVRDVRSAIYIAEIVGSADLGVGPMQESWQALIADSKGMSGSAIENVSRSCDCNPAIGHLGCKPSGSSLSIKAHGDVRPVLAVYFATCQVMTDLRNNPAVSLATHGIDFIAGNGGNGDNVVQLVRK